MEESRLKGKQLPPLAEDGQLLQVTMEGMMIMALVKKNKTDLNEKALIENAIAKAEKNEALLEYIAIMADIDLEEEEEENV